MMNDNNRRQIRSGISFRFELNSKPRRNGSYNVLFRITENRTHKRIATEVNVVKSSWDDKKEEIKKSDKESISKNLILQSIISNARQLQHEIEDVSSEKIYKELKGVKSSTKSACLYIYTDKIFLSDKPYNTKRNTLTVINKLKDFTKKPSLPFESIDREFIQNFEKYLKVHCGNCCNTIDTNLSKLKSIINHAARNESISSNINPFRLYKIKTSPALIERLDAEEVERIKELDLVKNSLIWHVRNYWLFSFYATGIRFSDIATLSWDNLCIESYDKGSINYKMGKNQKTSNVQMHKQSIEILAYYQERKSQKAKYVFPIINDLINLSNEEDLKDEISRKNALINKYLKKISALAEITKNLTFHISRHSFANIARNKGIDVYDISKSLRHSNLSITEQYLDKFDSTAIDRTMEKMFGDSI